MLEIISGMYKNEDARLGRGLVLTMRLQLGRGRAFDALGSGKDALGSEKDRLGKGVRRNGEAKGVRGDRRAKGGNERGQES